MKIKNASSRADAQRSGGAASRSDKKTDGLFVLSLGKAMRLLEAFGENQSEMGLGELARATGLHRSAVQRFALTFHQLGYLDKDPDSLHYRPSVRFLELANAYLWSDRTVQAAMPRLIELRDLLGETVNLARLDGEDIVYVVRQPSARTSYVAAIPGRRVPALNTASGRVMLGCMPREARVHAVQTWHLRRYTPQTELDREVILREIDAAAATQFCVAENQLLLNEISAAVPLQAGNGGAYAVQCSLSATGWTEQRVAEEIIPRLRDFVNSLIKPRDATPLKNPSGND